MLEVSDDFQNLTVQAVSHQPDVLGIDGKRPSEIQRETVERSSKIEKAKGSTARRHMFCPGRIGDTVVACALLTFQKVNVTKCHFLTVCFPIVKQ